MKELRKQIEEEAVKFAYSRIKDKNRQPDNDIFFAAKECGIEIGSLVLSKWQEATRWRQVSEELPDETGWDKAPYLAKTRYEITVVGFTEGRFHLKGGLCLKPNAVIAWRIY